MESRGVGRGRNPRRGEAATRIYFWCTTRKNSKKRGRNDGTNYLAPFFNDYVRPLLPPVVCTDVLEKKKKKIVRPYATEISRPYVAVGRPGRVTKGRR
ncbi:hypothetical protein OUZ56_005228 [Daphnia magna]|uniref:Uncharacterized protein n=1 Tax=Daphnia magna TaxID=35525 RepID=A0ABQ9YS77_9CRUS|nr:hypothetical protein OUZ56_005228 [Daphnia magna]